MSSNEFDRMVESIAKMKLKDKSDKSNKSNKSNETDEITDLIQKMKFPKTKPKVVLETPRRSTRKIIPVIKFTPDSGVKKKKKKPQDSNNIPITNATVKKLATAATQSANVKKTVVATSQTENVKKLANAISQFIFKEIEKSKNKRNNSNGSSTSKTKETIMQNKRQKQK